MRVLLFSGMEWKQCGIFRFVLEHAQKLLTRMCYAAIPGMELHHAQVKFYYADTMLTRASHVTYHVTNVIMAPNMGDRKTAPALSPRLNLV